MRRNILYAVVMAALLATAGCVDVADVGGAVPADDGTPEQKSSDGSAGDGNDGSAGDGSDDGASDGSAGDGNDGSAGDGSDGSDVEWTAANSAAALRDAGSFTSSWTWRTSDPETGTVQSMTMNSAVDLPNERVHRTTTVTGEDGMVMESFHAGGTVYSRMASGDGSDDPFYSVTEQEFDPDVVVDYRGHVYDSSDLDEWTLVGVEQYDGVTVRRYTYQGTDPWLGATRGDEEFRAESWTFTMLVDRDGIARYQSYHVDGVDADGNDVWVEWEYTVTGVGSTTVDDPDWLADAEAGAAGSP